MSLPLPPASNLHAVLLVTKSRSLGPRLVFHYPPLSPSAAALAANKAPIWFGNHTSTASVDSHSSNSEWDSSTENDGGDDDIEVGSRTSGGRGSGRTSASHRDREKYRPGGGGAWGRQENIDEDDGELDGKGNVKENGEEMDKGGDHDWNTVLGFKVDALEKMLCPSNAFKKKRFELGVESIVFVGAPVYVRDDGLWKKGRRRKKQKPLDPDLLANLKLEEEEEESKSSVKGSDSTVMEPFDHPQGFEPGYGHGLMSGAASGAVSEAGSDTRTNSTTENAVPDMTMFNVVFVLNPPALEYQLRVQEMYDNVARKYAKALKYEQARSQYVWKESKNIIDIKQRAKENSDSISATWRKIVNTSPLAKSIAIMFDAISNDKIAHVHFDATFSTSFQIPQRDSIPYLPSVLEPQMPGLWLTTSNVIIDDDNEAPMTQHAALLLLEDAETLVKELEGDAKGNATALAFYIRAIIPTKSLIKISIKHNILPRDMEYIARHLVYWRRARLIAPLHPRDTYIVSPNADMSALQAAIPSYAARFPTVPSLPKMLSNLSGTPKPFRKFIPTNEHREPYMEILAWLMRGGWVTQLRTFAWVRVPASIKAVVAQEMAQEASIKKAEEARREVSDTDSITESLLSDKRSSFLAAGRPSTPLRRTGRREMEDENMDASTILSPRMGPGWRGSPARPASDAGSTNSNLTAIPLSARPESPSIITYQQTKVHRPSPLHLKTTSPSRPPSTFSPTSPSNTGAQPPSPPLSPDNFTASLMLSPQKANSVEARWLEKIGQGFTDPDLREHWPMLLRHLDGKHALEDVGIQKGLGRKKVAAWVAVVNDMGLLVVVRHW